MDIKELIKKMSLEEKASLCSGKNMWETKAIKRLSIPSIYMADGPHGLRKEMKESEQSILKQSYPSTCFPTAVLTACSFNRSLINKMGKAIAKECILHDVDIILGPGVNMKRSPLCGRNFEYFSEDPYLSGELGAAYVSGVQGEGIGVSVKHYVANNQETLRQVVSSEIDERALRENYLASFKRIMDENPYTVMCSYNRLNGVYASENKTLLTDILRDEWGFDGVLLTDWGACNDRVLGLESGQDLEMPSSNGENDRLIVEAVKNGTLDESVLDQAIERILNIVFKCRNNKKVKEEVDHHKLAYEVASDSMVLLKNEENILPLDKNKSIGIIGRLAKNPRYQGSGSSKINPVKLDDVYQVMKDEKLDFQYADGYFLENDKIDDHLIQQAVDVAKDVDIPIVFIGLTENYESEGFDRDNMICPKSHNYLIQEIKKVNPNIVVVLFGGSPVEMPWIHDIKGLLNAYLSGESGARAIVDLLYGVKNPSGKLAETYPLKLEDNPSYENFPGGNNAVYYAESIYIGYRYYDKAKKNVRFPFGYGLSYTTFSYKNIKLNKKEMKDTETCDVQFTVKNTGKVEGREVCQLYIKPINPKVFKAVRELKGFEKVNLKPGEEKEISIQLDREAFHYYHIDLKQWVVEPGEYEIEIGSSSRDLHLKESIIINCKDVASPYKTEECPSYYTLEKSFNLQEFEKILKRECPPENINNKRPYTYNSTIKDLKKSFIGKILYIYFTKQIKKKTEDKHQQEMLIKSLLDIPYRMLVMMGGKAFSKKLADGLLLMMNRKYVKGFRKMREKND